MLEVSSCEDITGQPSLVPSCEQTGAPAFNLKQRTVRLWLGLTWGSWEIDDDQVNFALLVSPPLPMSTVLDVAERIIFWRCVFMTLCLYVHMH